ncbi:MAG: hypothetical protein FJZ56_02560 [Chlamydiae bacterium]|nr:hypothetical protein [Chlamydiota bacterium]
MTYNVQDAYDVKNAKALYDQQDKASTSATLPASLEELKQLLGSLLAGVTPDVSNDAQEAIDKLILELAKQFRILFASDPRVAGEMIAEFIPLFDMISQKDTLAFNKIMASLGDLFNEFAKANKNNNQKLHAFIMGLGNKILSSPEFKAKNSEMATTLASSPSSEESSTASTSTTLNFDSLFNADGLTMSLTDIAVLLGLCMQTFQNDIMQQEAKNNSTLSEQGIALVSVAQKDYDDLIKQIQKEHDAARKARKAKKNGFWIKIGVAVAGAAVTMLTMGAAACVVVMAMTAIMMSPLFDQAVNKLSQSLQEAGMGSHQADMLAKVIVILAVVALSGTAVAAEGMALAAEETAAVATEEAATAAVEDTGIEMTEISASEPGADAASEPGAEEAANGAAKTSALSRAKTFALIQGLSTFAALNPLDDVLREFHASDDALLACDIIVTVACVFALLLGPTSSMMNASQEAPTLARMGAESLNMEEFFLRAYTPVSQGLRFTEATLSGAAAIFQGEQAAYQYEMADCEGKEADLIADSQMAQFYMNLANSLQKSNADSLDGIVSGMQSALNLVNQDAGMEMGAAARAIAST